MPRIAVLLTGVGGQGVLTAAQMLGAAAHDAGLPVVVGQLHGMSQRGGTIECAVLIGSGQSSFIGPGEADLVLAFERLEALRALPRMHERTSVVANLAKIVPFEIFRTDGHYPTCEETIAALRSVARGVHGIEGADLVREAGADRTLNSVMLGAACALGRLPIDPRVVLAAIERRAGQRFLEANRRAFSLGRDAVDGNDHTAREASA